MLRFFWQKLGLVCFLNLSSSLASAELVKDGIADLTSMPADQLVNIQSLNGRWEFYWKHLYTPEELSKITANTYLAVPSSWTKTYESFGFATYQAHITLPAIADYALEMADFSTATRVFVNGELLFESGVVSENPERSQPSRSKFLVRLPPAMHYDIVIWISNFEHQHGGIKSPPRLGLFEKIQLENRRTMLLDAFVFAAIFMIGLYHFVLFLIRKDSAPLMLSLVCLATAIRVSVTGTRIAHQFFDLPFVFSYDLEYLGFFLIGTTCEFLILFLFPLDYPRNILKFRIACHAAVYTLMLTPLSVMSKYLWIPSLHSFGIILISIYIIAKAVKNNRVGAAWISRGSILFSLIAIHDIIQGMIAGQSPLYLLSIGFIGFILSTSASIAQIYDHVATKMKEAVDSKRHTMEQLNKIVYPHQIEMISSGQPIESTMPTHQGEACVLCFDIVNSSAIQHEKTKEFFRSIFMRCNEIMMEGYNGKELKAGAYRIKEMGDGFLCSIGYPFRSLKDHMAQDAFALAQRFITVFHEESARLEYPEPLTCGLGLALESIEGFYPASGAKEYDLYGKAIILATRYEAMRKAIIKPDERVSTIILQEKVFFSLSAEQRSLFEQFDLEKNSIVVRDDTLAKVLYVLKIPPAQKFRPVLTKVS